MKVRLCLIRTWSNFYMTSDNHDVSLGSVDCSLYTRYFALKDTYHRARKDMFAYTPVDYNFLEVVEKTIIIPSRENQFLQESVSKDAPFRRIAIAMNTNSAFTASYTEKPFCYQKFDLRQSRILREGQPMVNFYAAINCCSFVIGMRARWQSRNSNWQFQRPLISTVWFYFQERCYWIFLLPRTIRRTGETAALNLNFSLGHVSKIIVLGDRMSSVATDKFGSLERISEFEKATLQQIKNPTLYWNIGSLDHSLQIAKLTNKWNKNGAQKWS